MFSMFFVDSYVDYVLTNPNQRPPARLAQAHLVGSDSVPLETLQGLRCNTDKRNAHVDKVLSFDRGSAAIPKGKGTWG